MATLTVRIDDRLDAQLRDLAARTGVGTGAFVREAIRRRLLVVRLEELRRAMGPFAEACGWSTDEDVFREVS